MSKREVIMKQEEMLKYCREMLFALQKVRSNEFESLGNVNKKVLDMIMNDLVPWTGGEKGKLTINALQKVIDREHVTGMEFYNFMTIAYGFDNGMIAMWLSLTNKIELPKPDVSLILGDL